MLVNNAVIDKYGKIRFDQGNGKLVKITMAVEPGEEPDLYVNDIQANKRVFRQKALASLFQKVMSFGAGMLVSTVSEWAALYVINDKRAQKGRKPAGMLTKIGVSLASGTLGSAVQHYVEKSFVEPEPIQFYVASKETFATVNKLDELMSGASDGEDFEEVVKDVFDVEYLDDKDVFDVQHLDDREPAKDEGDTKTEPVIKDLTNDQEPPEDLPTTRTRSIINEIFSNMDEEPTAND